MSAVIIRFDTDPLLMAQALIHCTCTVPQEQDRALSDRGVRFCSHQSSSLRAALYIQFYSTVATEN